MARRWEEQSSRGLEEKKRSNRGWFWTLTVLLVGAVIALIFAFRISSYAVDKSRQAEQQAQAAATSAQQAHDLAAKAMARADSAVTAEAMMRQRVLAVNVKMLELASRQYAIEVRADRLDSAVMMAAADLNKLGELMNHDFKVVSGRIDSTLAVAEAASTKADEAQRSAAQLHGGFDALRSDLDRRVGSMKWQNRLAVGLGVVNTVVWGIHIAPDSHHK
ncbi:MAG: hypothetical protein HY567_04530 [Candidatus Kerfeldbacteria bacterium]|nr:hypothetical protein [Candidatus Kerfeldbacteria bacterium]